MPDNSGSVMKASSMTAGRGGGEDGWMGTWEIFRAWKLTSNHVEGQTSYFFACFSDGDVARLKQPGNLKSGL